MFGKPAFGAPAPSTSFGGSGLFGQVPSTGGGLFNTSSTFGQQNKPATFGFSNTPQTGTFLGAQQPQASSIFNTSGGSSLFGGTTGFVSQQTGTVIKFVPVTGNDTMMKNGTAQSISTKHHSITCMKEYEGKSFEELRMEDYQANRKGPQQGVSGFGSPAFGGGASATPLFGQTDANKSAFGQTSAFGQGTAFGQQSTGFGATAFGAGATTTPSLFGATDANKQSAFGQSTFGQTSTFGQPATGGFGMGAQQSTTGSPFGKPAFGATTSTTGFGFGSTAPQNANPFGASTANKPFGTGLQTQTQPVLFGGNTSQPSTGFGTGLFSNTQNTGSSLFNKPAQPTTGFGAAGQTSGFGFNAPASTQPSLFSNQAKPLFGGTTTTSVVRSRKTTKVDIPSRMILDCLKASNEKKYVLKAKALDIKEKMVNLEERRLNLEDRKLSLQEKLIDLKISEHKANIEMEQFKNVAIKMEKNIVARLTSYEQKVAGFSSNLVATQEKLINNLLSTEQKFVDFLLGSVQKS